VFPPLAAGTYALFANPESEYASPVRFVAGVTAGAVCAWIAMQVAIRFIYPSLPPTAIEVDAPGAAFAVFLTGVVTWALDIEEAAAFSMALLGLLVDPTKQGSFVVSVFLASSIVAGIFTVWRDLFYEQRAHYLYQSVKGDDRVLVPMRGNAAEATAMLGARLAAAHDAGKVVLLASLETEEPEADQGVADASGESGPAGILDWTEVALSGAGSAAEEVDEEVAATVADLEGLAHRIETTLGVPCQVVVVAAGASEVRTVRQAARETNCDLVATPYETDEDGELAQFVAQLLNSRLDVLVHRSYDGRTEWRRVVVPVKRASDTAHAMIDFALRLVGSDGRVSVAHCIDSKDRRRQGDEMLANLVETADGRIETRVAKASIERFLRRVARANDLIIVGASRERSRASRLISPPTFEQVDDLETDIAVVDRS
jgi:nucleotide-binding universal stress UspA family protein